jgi:predicted TIM-barrel fold metal-dependent hydrolase
MQIIDSHVHVIDPARFPYAADAWYKPTGAEIGTTANLHQVLDAHGISKALLVGPNSGYNTDNRCILDAIAHSAGRFKGVALVHNNASLGELQDLKAQGVIGAAMNVSLLGVDFYSNIAPLLQHLRDLDMFAQMQVQHEQLLPLRDMLVDSGAKLVFDHCGRPDPAKGVQQAGFQALLALAETGRASVKLSGFNKASALPHPYPDALQFVHALIDAYTPHNLVWASDWPFLRAPARIDYAPLLKLFEQWVPDAKTRHTIQCETPKRLFGFGVSQLPIKIQK